MDKTFNKGKKIFSPYFVCYITKADVNQTNTRFLVIASKKVGNAVKRSRAKRLLRVVAKNTCKLFEELNIGSIILIARSEIIKMDSNALTDIFTEKVKKLYK